MKQICTLLLSLLLACGIMFAQESTATVDIDAYVTTLDDGSAETINSGVLTLGSPEAATSDQFGSHILQANPGPNNNSGNAGWAIFFDLIAGPRGVTITGMTTASDGVAGVSYNLEFFTRSGSALGGPVGSGPGSSPAGWTSLGTVPFTQGATTNGVSLLFATPVININPGDTTGVALLFIDIGPRYTNGVSPPYGIYADTNLTLITGDSRSVPFTPTGSFFTPRELTGEIHYDEPVPVELVSFTASVNDNDVTLNWETATEINNSGFQVEKKSNGEYEAIGFVPGFGTTTEPRSYNFTDADVQSGYYAYRLKQIDLDGTFEYSAEIQVEVTIPDVFALEQNYPNPFNPSTRIDFSLAVDSKVNLKVFDVLGQEVATLINSDLVAGSHNVEFNAANINSGVYFYILQTGDFVETKKMVLLR